MVLLLYAGDAREGDLEWQLLRLAARRNLRLLVCSADLSRDASWDLTVPEVRAGAAENANVTVRMTEEDFIDMVEGRLQGPAAFMTGKLKIEGDLSLAMKLGQVLDVREG